MERTLANGLAASDWGSVMTAFPISQGERNAAIQDGLGVRMIGPEEAAILLTLNRRNRRVSPATVERLADDMRRGLWLDTGSNDITIWEDLKTGEAMLVNGQHRLNAVVASGTRQKFLLVRRTSEQTSLEALFAAMDQGKPRTSLDLRHVEEFGGGAGRESERHLDAALSAVILLELTIRGILDGEPATGATQLSVPRKAEFGARYDADIRWGAALRMRQTKGRRRPMPVGILAAAIACHRIASDEATKFFVAVSVGADIHEGQPEWVLRDTWLRGGDLRRTKQARAAHLYWYGLAINAWNHHCQGGRVDVLRSLEITRCVIRRPRDLDGGAR